MYKFRLQRMKNRGLKEKLFILFFQYAVLIDVPKDIRIERVKNRSFQKVGNRMSKPIEENIK